MHTALNCFGFDSGAADGAVGPRTRGAVSRYQPLMGWQATGQINDFERGFVISAYQRAMAGGPVTAQTAAANPMGKRGLLPVYRDEMAGSPGTVAAGRRCSRPRSLRAATGSAC